jgi:hypothetical protein
MAEILVEAMVVLLVLVMVDLMDDLLVDMMVSVGKSCVDTAELTSFWKHNQGEIDLLKVNNPDEFKRLQEAFAEYKLNLKKD